MMLEIESAEGVFLFDKNGKKYYDLISGVNVSALGHNHPAIVNAVKNQVDKYMHVMVYGEFMLQPQMDYAGLVTSFLPDKLSSVYFVNSGAEAVEGALKLAKKYTGKAEMISCRNSYHGSTQGAMSMMGGEYFKKGYYPLLPGTMQIGFNSIKDLQRISDKTACVLIEVMQAEAGMILPEPGYLEALRERCDETGALLIFDEIQTGLGRLGNLFGFETFGVVPDILVLAKSFGGGMPLGAFISSNEIMEKISYGPALGHITTFGGHPVCCAAGKACLETILDDDLFVFVQEKEELFRKNLVHPSIVEIRGKGMMLAVEMGSKDLMLSVVDEGLKEGFVTDWFLFCESAFRISPPLNITNEEIKDISRIINDAIEKAVSQ
jgi:acetylornithine/succinyldiaminopimelate/putrescine aminotransferase